MRIDPHYVFLPVEASPTGVLDVLDWVPGETYRWLLPRSAYYAPGDSIRLYSPAFNDVVVGKLRRVRGETYTDLVLTVGNAPADYRQFALYVNDTPITTTFYPRPGGYASAKSYAQAITRHLSNQPLLGIEVWRSNQTIYVRLHDSERLNLAEQRVSVGLGRVMKQNDNAPSLSVQLSSSEAKAAAWPYRVTVGASVVAGNEYNFNGVAYTAVEGDTVASVRLALGLPANLQTPVELPSATYPVAVARAGTGRVANVNTPSLTLRYTGTASGNNQFQIVVGGNIAVGNVYQISVPGQADRVVTASADLNTPAALASALVAGGVLSVPTGVEPVALSSRGFRDTKNTNTPGLTLEVLPPLPARTVRHWSAYVGTDVRAGNTFELSIDGAVSRYVAGVGDTRAEVIAGLNQQATGGGFSLDTADTVTVTGLARRGPAYRSPDQLAPITLTQVPRPVMAPLVAELTVLVGLTGTFVIKIGTGTSPVRIRLSTATLIQGNGAVNIGILETSLLRWSGGEGLEDNLQCQLRLPLLLTAPRFAQTEQISRDLSDTEHRQGATARQAYQLTTKTVSAQFHRALWAALKSGRIRVDGRDLEQLGDYTQSEGPAPTFRGQGRAVLFAVRQQRTNGGWEAPGDYVSGSYAQIDRLQGEAGLRLWVRGATFEGELREGLQLPAGMYELRCQTGADALHLRVEGPQTGVSRYLLWAARSNRVRNLRLEPGSYVVTLTPTGDGLAKPSKTQPNGAVLTPQAAFGDPETVLASAAETRDVPDFNDDFNFDYD